MYSQVALSFIKFGGDKRDRTADLLNAIQALSQLSYAPIRLTKCIIKIFVIFVNIYSSISVVQPFSCLTLPSFISLPKALLKPDLLMPKTSLMTSAGVSSP